MRRLCYEGAVWANLKQSLGELRRAPPGERFRRCYSAWRERQRESYVVTVLYVAVGIVFVAAGIVFSFWPVIPGFVFVLAGFALISARSKWMAHRLDRFELACRRRLPRRWVRTDGNAGAGSGAQRKRR